MSQSACSEPLREWRGDESPLLTRDELDDVLGLLGEIAPGWSADLDHAGIDGSTIVITPAGANDMIGPAFVLHRSRGRFQLDQVRWDEFRRLGGFHTFNEAQVALRARMAPLTSHHAAESDQAHP
jgi:hypothetical protein